MEVNAATLAGIYTNFSIIFNQEMATIKAMHDLVAMTVPSTGKQVDYKWLGNIPMMREWIGDRQIKNLEAFDYAIKNKKFESTIGVDRDDIDDDQVGVYKPIIRGLAHAAGNHPSMLIYALMKDGFSKPCFDGQYFFDTDHPVAGASVSNFGGGSGTPWFLLDLSKPIKPMVLQIRRRPRLVSITGEKDENVFMRNEFLYGVDDRKNVGFGLWQLAYGSKDTLDTTNLEAGLAAMGSLKNNEGVPLNITPTHLAYPPTLEGAARRTVEIMLKTGGESNEWYKVVKLAKIPWLA